jgi:hypothetical protein
MKVYFLSPSFDVLATENRNEDTFRPYLDAGVPVVIDAIRPTGDERLLGVWDIRQVGMENEPFDDEYAGTRIRHLRTHEALFSVLRRTAAPFDVYHMWVRCQTTCRSVHFIDDGKVYLCLPHADPSPPISSLIHVEDRSSVLAETDLLDGCIDAEDQEESIGNVVAFPIR